MDGPALPEGAHDPAGPELLVCGILLGGLHALMAGGLNLIFGVIRVVNSRMSLLGTYAVSTILVNGAILVWGGGYRGLPGVLAGSVNLCGEYALSFTVQLLVFTWLAYSWNIITGDAGYTHFAR